MFSVKSHRLKLSGYWLIVPVALLLGCNPTKHVPSDKFLLSKVRVICDNKTINQQELKSCIRQKENKKILGVRFHLGLYNLSNLDNQKKLHKYLRSIGEEPVHWELAATNASINQLQNYLTRKGYIHAKIKDTVIYKKKKMVEVLYTVQPNQPYTIRSLTYFFEDTSMRKYVFQDTVSSLIRTGKQALYDYDIIGNERARIEYLLRNNGFYRFNRDLIYFDADTALGSNQVDLVMNVTNETSKLPNGQIMIVPSKRYKLNQVVIRTENDRYQEEDITAGKTNSTDTIMKYGVKFIYQNNFWVKPSIIQQSNYIIPGALFKISDVEETKSHISSLNVFSLVNTSQFKEIPNDTSVFNYLDCQIKLTPLSIQSYDWGLVGTNSSGNFGGALNLIYQHRSLFGNAENLVVKFRGALEAVKQNNSNVIGRALEYGVETTLNIPKFLMPFNSMSFKKKYNPKTYLTLAYNYQERPEFTRTVANLSFGYNWKGKRYRTHIVTPLEINYVNVPKISQKFQDSIRFTYLENLYNKHIVTSSGYSYIYNNQDFLKTSDYRYFRLNVESSGNLLSAINSLTNKTKEYLTDSTSISGGASPRSFYTLSGLQYSQYLKTDVDFHYFHVLNESSGIVYRLFGGVGVPYNNATSIPFEKQYSSGGANSIRGWQVMTLGPGSYIDNKRTYPNSTGDIKLEGNIEYRFKLFWIFESALFADAGNVWLLSGKEKPQNGVFKWDRFYKQIALSSGLGLRLNFNYFIFRIDCGMKLHNPTLNEGHRWFFKYDKITHKDFALSFAIGYPF